jgi:hypothetical protein
MKESTVVAISGPSRIRRGCHQGECTGSVQMTLKDFAAPFRQGIPKEQMQSREINCPVCGSFLRGRDMESRTDPGLLFCLAVVASLDNPNRVRIEFVTPS